MSEQIPESIPTSSDPRSKRPTKRLALTPTSQQSNQIEALFANPEKEIATEAPTRNGLAPPPEIVPNVQGSSAGAGSGEFHVYKASRRREYERLRAMEEDVKEEKEREEFERAREERLRKDEAKREKNRAKREKSKKNKGKGGKADKEVKEDGKIKGPAPGVINSISASADKKNATQGAGKVSATETETAEPATEEIGLVIHDDD